MHACAHEVLQSKHEICGLAARTQCSLHTQPESTLAVLNYRRGIVVADSCKSAPQDGFDVAVKYCTSSCRFTCARTSPRNIFSAAAAQVDQAVDNGLVQIDRS